MAVRLLNSGFLDTGGKVIYHARDKVKVKLTKFYIKNTKGPFEADTPISAIIDIIDVGGNSIKRATIFDYTLRPWFSVDLIEPEGPPMEVDSNTEIWAAAGADNTIAYSIFGDVVSENK